VINCRFVKPLDVALITNWVKKIPRIITVEENIRQGGFGSAVLEALIDAGLSGFQLERIGIPDKFVEHGPQTLLRSKYGIDSDAIVDSAKKILNRHSGENAEWASRQAV
jgi:1-deoxy-D-xylulose-5-phosphate synthase